jgi:hypothetical protein
MYVIDDLNKAINIIDQPFKGKRCLVSMDKIVEVHVHEWKHHDDGTVWFVVGWMFKTPIKKW